MTGFFSLVILSIAAYFIWRIADQMPDVLFRLSEIQRDIAELRRQGQTDEPTKPASKAKTKSST